MAGATGAVVGTPAEISLIRMTADGRYIYTEYYVHLLNQIRKWIIIFLETEKTF